MFEPRSLLFIPADAERYVAKAAARGADAIVLDLEDGVAPTAKSAARASLARSVPRLHADGALVYVRVNHVPHALESDLQAAVAAGADAIVLPKVEDPGQLQELDRVLADLGSAATVIGLVETPLGICRAIEIAHASPRLRALCLGSEDFAASMGVEPSPESLEWPAHALAVAAVAAGVQPLGLAGSVGNFSNLEAYRDLVARSRRLGLRGSVCIHPAQVHVLNELFGASEAEVRAAERLVAAFDIAVKEGRGAIAVDGRMVDEPVAQRARVVLQRHAARAARTITPGSKQP